VSGGLNQYQVRAGRVVVTARSSVHDTRTVFGQMGGTIHVDPAEPAKEATAELRVDMRVFDAGDRLKNWKLKGDLKPDLYPTATFRLTRIEDVKNVAGRFEAKAMGVLSWRGRQVDVEARGHATLGERSLEASCRFELNVRALGVEPPKILMLKVEEVVGVEVTLSGTT
jgi:polyisoprenoid-binding protein YceI